MDKPKLIIFDVDGVLLQNYEFSWKLVWNYLNYDDSIRKKGFSMYIHKILTYQEWCDWCLKYFKEKNINYMDFETMSTQISVDSSLFELLRYCKRENILLGIVSGGIDTFLNIVLPNIYDYVHEENVFINKFYFDSKNKLSSIIPTKYDFEDKLNAIKHICSKHSLKLSEVMFLGDNMNDFEALKEVGFSVAFNTKHESILSISKFSCSNFTEVLRLIQ